MDNSISSIPLTRLQLETTGNTPKDEDMAPKPTTAQTLVKTTKEYINRAYVCVAEIIFTMRGVPDADKKAK